MTPPPATAVTHVSSRKVHHTLSGARQHGRKLSLGNLRVNTDRSHRVMIADRRWIGSIFKRLPIHDMSENRLAAVAWWWPGESVLFPFEVVLRGL
jgi:hypothetical protein